jgi:glucose-6-phosphate isomerase
MKQAVPLTSRTTWQKLKEHYPKVRALHLRTLFSDDPIRAEKMTVEAIGVTFDYSKQRVTHETIGLLLKMAEESELRSHAEEMFRGEKINVTEKRAVLHVALRAPKECSIFVDGKDVVPLVHEVLDRMSDFSDRIRCGDQSETSSISALEDLILVP